MNRFSFTDNSFKERNKIRKHTFVKINFHMFKFLKMKIVIYSKSNTYNYYQWYNVRKEKLLATSEMYDKTFAFEDIQVLEKHKKR